MQPGCVRRVDGFEAVPDLVEPAVRLVVVVPAVEPGADVSRVQGSHPRLGLRSCAVGDQVEALLVRLPADARFAEAVEHVGCLRVPARLFIRQLLEAVSHIQYQENVNALFFQHVLDLLPLLRGASSGAIADDQRPAVYSREVLICGEASDHLLQFGCGPLQVRVRPVQTPGYEEGSSLGGLEQSFRLVDKDGARLRASHQIDEKPVKTAGESNSHLSAVTVCLTLAGAEVGGIVILGKRVADIMGMVPGGVMGEEQLPIQAALWFSLKLQLPYLVCSYEGEERGLLFIGSVGSGSGLPGAGCSRHGMRRSRFGRCRLCGGFAAGCQG